MSYTIAMRITDRAFFTQPVLDMCYALLGKLIVRRFDSGEIKRFRITEVEAYGGKEDSASHASKGMTKRTVPMFEEGGTVYVYLCYGIFDILNFVSGEKGDPQGVMIRGVQEVEGVRVEGPGRSSRLMNITRELNMENLVTSDKIWVESEGVFDLSLEMNAEEKSKVFVGEVECFTRVGIGYATKEDQEKLWRFKLNI